MPEAEPRQTELLNRLTILLSPREREAAPRTDSELTTWVAQRTRLPVSLLEQARTAQTLKLGPYTITGRIGRGGMGAVLSGRDTNTGRDVAIKLLQGEAPKVAHERFAREAQALARLDHPNIVRLYAFEREQGLSYLVLELVPGVSLERRIRSKGPLDEVHAWNLLAQAADALACAARAGILHRDIKPGNILWIEEANTYKLCDFGIARFQGAANQLTAAGTTLGTPAYMSPEQATGAELDVRSDMYSLGLTLHEVLTSTVPFEGGAIGAMLTRRVDEDVPSVRLIRAGVSERLDGLLASLTVRQREGRPTSWEAFGEAVAEAAVAEGIVLAQPTRRPSSSGLVAAKTRAQEFDPSDPTVPFSPVLDTPPEPDPTAGRGLDLIDDPPLGMQTLREPAIGELLGDYRLDGVLGRGGMGVVYRATKLKTQKVYAVKVVVVSQGEEGARRRERFGREVEALRRLAHSNIVRVHTYGRKDPFDWYAMDLIEGRELNALLTDSELRLSKHQKLTIFISICKAVTHAHENGVIHRDLKPSNVLVDSELRPYVLDFGLAKITDESKQGLTRTGAFLGTPYYMAPEQFLDPRSVDARIDIFSLGVMLYELAVGQRPFEGDTAAEVSYKIMREKPVRPTRANAKVEPAFDAICLKALHKKPGDRYQTVDALKKDIVRLRHGSAQAEPLIQRLLAFTARWMRDNRAGVIVGALLATIAYIPVVGVLYWLLLED